MAQSHRGQGPEGILGGQSSPEKKAVATGQAKMEELNCVETKMLSRKNENSYCNKCSPN